MAFVGYIYRILCKTTRERYIGSTTVSVEHRFKTHLNNALYFNRKGRLYDCIRKHGAKAFEVKVCEKAYFESKTDLFSREDVYILAYRGKHKDRLLNAGTNAEILQKFKFARKLKTYRIFFDNQTTTITDSLTAFAKKNGYTNQKLYDVLNGKRNFHKNIARIVCLTNASETESGTES